MPDTEHKTPRARALDLDRNISVTAGAGSGKTRILVDRFLKLVTADPGKVRRILTITFTEKAAGELQERIAKEIDELLQTDDRHDYRHNDLLYIRDHLNSAYISTIHGFCSRILHEFPFESGLTPDFRVIDEIEQAVFIRQSVRSVMEQIDEPGTTEDKQAYYELFTRISRYRIEEMLERALTRAYDMECLLTRFDGWTADEYIQYAEDLWSGLYGISLGSVRMEPFAGKVREILDDVPSEPVSDKGLKALMQLQHFLHHYQAGPEFISTRSAFIEMIRGFTTASAGAYKNLAQLGGKGDWSAKNMIRIPELSAMCSMPARRLLDLDPGPPPSGLDLEWFRVMTTILSLYHTVKNRFAGLKAESGSADFDDLQMCMLKLMENETVQRELCNRFDAVLVDEFQDTDQLQWQIISRLTSSNGQLTPNKLFIVGDPKQSIYGFRNADIRVFRDVKRQFAEQAGCKTETDYPGNITFTDSYRFLPGLNAFINHLFSHILRESEYNDYEVGYHPLTSQRNVPNSGNTEIALFTGEDDGVQTECRYMAQTICDLMADGAEVHIRDREEERTRPICHGDIAILLRSRTHLLSVEQVLRSAGIPYKTAGGIGFWQRQEIYDFYYLLRFLNNTADDLSLVALLRSRFFVLPDTVLYALSGFPGATFLEKLTSADPASPLFRESERPWIERAVYFISKWIRIRERVPLSELLFTILHDTALKSVLSAELNGEQLASNLDKLIALAQSFDGSGLGGLNEFMIHMDDLISREIREPEALVNLEDDQTVKIMTIHAAKGLQFPVVFVPFLNTQHGGPRENVLINPDLGIAMKIRVPGSGMDSSEHTLYHMIDLRESQKESAEARRLFYVAASRASERLYLCCALKKGKIVNGSPLSWMQSCFGEDGASLPDDERLDYDDFHVDIRHQLAESPDQTPTPVSFFSEMENLKSIVSSHIPEPQPCPIYLEAMDSRVSGRVFSATMIMTYMDDPEEYYERYHLGFFKSDYESFGSGRAGSDHNMLLGQIVHRYLEKWGHLHKPEHHVIDRLFFEFDILDPQVRSELGAELGSILDNVSSSDNARRILGAEKFRNEVSVTMKLGDDYLTGTLDRMVQNESGDWEIVDFKTNRITAGKVAVTAKSYEWQMKTYALLLSRLFPGQDILPVSLYFIRPDVIHRILFTQKDMDVVAGWFEDIIQRIKHEYPVRLP